MGKRRKLKALVRRELSLEEQLAELDAEEVPGREVRDTMGGLIIPPLERQEWARKRSAIVGAMRQRDAERLADPGPDASGRFGVSPYLEQHGHIVRSTPKKLKRAEPGKVAPDDSAFPKRIITQRMVDRYLAHGHIADREWRAADALWRAWCAAELEAKVTSGYEPVTTSGTANQDHKIAKRIDGAREFLEAISAVPYRSQGVVRAVVVQDWSASQWARGRGYTGRDSESHGLERLRAGLSALAAFLGY